MSLLSFFQTIPEQDDVVLFVEVGSGSVACAIVQYDTHGPHTLATSRKDLPFQEKVTARRLYALIEESLKKNLDEMIAQHPSLPHPKNVCVALASPWCISQTRVVRYEQDDSFQVTKSSLRHIIEKEEELFLQHATQPSGLFSHPLVVSGQVMQTQLNGYSVEHPIGKNAVSIEIFVHYSAMPTHMHDVLEQIIHSRWVHVPIMFQTYLFGIYVALRDGQRAHSSFVIADVASEVSDIALVHNGVLFESLSFPVGTKSIVRSLASLLSLSPYVVETELRAYTQGKLSEARAQKIESYLEDSLGEWGGFFTQAVSSFEKTYPIPEKTYLVARHWVRSQFQSYIEQLLQPHNHHRDVQNTVASHVLDIPEYQHANCHDPFLCVMMMLYKSYSQENNIFHL
jgi:hypothetical protein